MIRFLTTLTVIVLLVLAVVGGTASGLLYFDRAKLETETKDLREKFSQREQRIIVLEGEIMELREADGEVFTASDCFSKSTQPRIIINQPCQGAEITKSVKVVGAAWGLFEAVMDYELLVDNTKVSEGFINTGIEMGNLGYVNETITLTYPDSAKGKEGVLRFFETSAADGSQQFVVDVRVVLK